MYCTNGFQEDTFEELKKKYIEAYADSAVHTSDVVYLVYHHPSGMEVSFSNQQVNDFIDDINDTIKYNNEQYYSQKGHEHSYTQPY